MQRDVTKKREDKEHSDVTDNCSPLSWCWMSHLQGAWGICLCALVVRYDG